MSGTATLLNDEWETPSTLHYEQMRVSRREIAANGDQTLTIELKGVRIESPGETQNRHQSLENRSTELEQFNRQTKNKIRKPQAGD